MADVQLRLLQPLLPRSPSLHLVGEKAPLYHVELKAGQVAVDQASSVCRKKSLVDICGLCNDAFCTRDGDSVKHDDDDYDGDDLVVAMGAAAAAAGDSCVDRYVLVMMMMMTSMVRPNGCVDLNFAAQGIAGRWVGGSPWGC